MQRTIAAVLYLSASAYRLKLWPRLASIAMFGVKHWPTR